MSMAFHVRQNEFEARLDALKAELAELKMRIAILEAAKAPPQPQRPVLHSRNA